MKKLYVLILSVLLPTLSISQPPAGGLPREVKEWCLSVNEQNKDLQLKVHRKDSIEKVQDSLLRYKNNQIASYQRDSTSWQRSEQAFGESLARKDTVIAAKDRVIRRRTVQRDATWGGVALLILIMLL